MFAWPCPWQVIAESQPGVGHETRPFYDFLESCLRHKSEVVIFEAARAICNMRDVTSRELTPAITVLHLFLTSSKPVLRFSAVRTLNKVRSGCACVCPRVWAACMALQSPSAAAICGAACSSLTHPCGIPLGGRCCCPAGGNVAPHGGDQLQH